MIAKKSLMILLGFTFLVLGVIGALLPVLPTTPFLLLASYCFVRGSERVHRWFSSTSLYRNHLERLATERAMTAKAKFRILALAFAMLLAAFFATDHLHVKGLIIALMAAKLYFFVFRIGTLPPLEKK